MLLDTTPTGFKSALHAPYNFHHELCRNTEGLAAAKVTMRYTTSLVHAASREAGAGSLHGARFRQKFTLEDAIGSHYCSLEALACMDQWHSARVVTPLTG
jgi:hypothetical protein